MGDDIANRHLGWIALWAFVGVVVLGIGIALADAAPKAGLGWLWWLVGLCGVTLLFSVFAAVSPFTGTWPFRERRRIRSTRWLSTLDPLTPLDVPMKPSTLSDHFKEPFTEGEPDYSVIPTDLSKLQPAMLSVPDFTVDWAERDRLLQRCAGSVEEPEAVWAWITAVYNKLFAWSPLKAMEFRPDPSAQTEPPLFMASVAMTMKHLEQGAKYNKSRQNLTMYGERLARIVSEERESQR